MSEEKDTCYICYEEQSEENKFANPNPCNCRGTIKIHRTCFGILTEQHDTCGVCMTKFRLNGYKKYYYPDGGPLKGEGLLVNGLEVGLWKYWYEENDQLQEKINYVDGIKNGLFQSWYYNGQLCIEVNYINGEMDGLYQCWSEDGQLYMEVHYVNGQRSLK
jgi:hypothetical protein